MPEKEPKTAILLRIPESLKARLEAHAASLGISMNADATTLLHRALRDEEGR